MRIEDEVLEKLKVVCGTDNVSEAVRIAILLYLQNNNGLEKVTSILKVEYWSLNKSSFKARKPL